MLNLLKSGEGFTPPSTNDFNLPSFFNNNPYFTKPIAELFLAVILISVFFILASRKAAVVPGKLQFAGESVYEFVRNSIAKDIIGHEFIRFVPFLFTLFTFILVNNIFGIVPLIQFPSMSHVSFPYVLAIFTYVVFHYIGIKKQGFVKYMKGIMFLPGVPRWSYVLLTPLEFATYFIIRPVTRSLRLFANMFVGVFFSNNLCWLVVFMLEQRFFGLLFFAKRQQTSVGLFDKSVVLFRKCLLVCYFC